MMDICEWSPLHVRYVMSVANAKFFAFADAANDIGELVHLGLLSRPEAADLLQEIATYNQLTFEYGQDRIQKVMAEGLHE
ncbi:hypothetical protein QY049_03255 [Bradyrhizobium sp. WYCCWR 13022]|uniref:hypothetical protein n=1 Tax=unclassified Bradyrhizobium TaxID=2631580 RepID=UPI00263B2E8F|nr:hypothetical protein [Bradyrhizobium sp. WYCCWR 13022]MDN4982243.1 hypothetical protein [Bradyrhizobium sp. WYCCWR 13022]